MADSVDKEIQTIIKETIANMPHVSRMDKNYILAGHWRCDKSPTDAHHWIETGDAGVFQCKYCKAVRKFPRYYGIKIQKEKKE